MMHVTSHCVVMFFWTAVCVRTLNSSSVEDINTNATPTPCFLVYIGDNPYAVCGMNMHCYSSLIHTSKTIRYTCQDIVISKIFFMYE